MKEDTIQHWTTTFETATTDVAIPTRNRDVHVGDRVFYWILKIFAWSFVLLLVGMLAMLTFLSWEAIRRFGWHFFTNSNWDVYRKDFGVLPMLYGTAVSSLIALALAIPMSFGVAIFLNELAPRWVARPLGFFVEMLAAIPSIVYGLWGLFVLAPFLRNHVEPFLGRFLGWLPFFSGPPFGIGMLCAGIVLAIMIVPTIAAIAREVFKTIPAANREAALGLGATRWEMLQIAVLRASVSGLIAAVILGLGRALGETMAVTMVIGNSQEISWSLFSSGQTMASLLANQYAEADGNLHLAALTYVGLCLFLVSLLINGAARLAVWRVESRFRGGRW
jgi:phosphate transport system permease protein